MRTWITATLLYGNNNRKTLNLYIAPFLKEKTTKFGPIEIKRGNFPKKIIHTMPKFALFLNNISKILENYEKILNEIYKLTSVERPITDEEGFELPESIVFRLPPMSPPQTQTIVVNKNADGKYIISETPNICDIKDTVGPVAGSEFIKNGNLQSFMNWFESDENYYKPIGKKVHVVTHSNVMQSYFSKEFNTSIKDLYPSVIKSNTWRFNTIKSQKFETPDMFKTKLSTMPPAVNCVTELHAYAEYIIHKFEIAEGVPMNESIAKSIETIYNGLSLCGTSGSVKTIQCDPVLSAAEDMIYIIDALEKQYSDVDMLDIDKTVNKLILFLNS